MKPDNVQTKVLIAEDTVVGRKVVARILSEAGFEVDAVENGLGVLDLLAATRYDMLIMDCMMPEMDGFACLKELKDRSITVPVIVVTALNDETKRQQANDLGVVDYILKPDLFEHLPELLDQHLPGPRDPRT